MATWLKISNIKFAVALVLLVGIFLRMIQLRELFHFEMDEEVIAWKVRAFVTTGKPFLIGGGTPFGLHVGPAFYYLSAIGLWFSHLDPIAWGVMAALASFMLLFGMWSIATRMFNWRVGFLYTSFSAFSFVQVAFDRHWWPLVLDPLLALVTFFSCWKILKEDRKWWVVLGGTLAFAWQTDLTNLILFLVAALVLIHVVARHWKRELVPYLIVAALILVASVAPLLLFEVRHPGANIGKALSYHPPASSFSLAVVPRVASFIPAALSELLFPATHQDGDLLRVYTWCARIALDRVTQQPMWAVGVALVVILYAFFRLQRREKAARQVITYFWIAGYVGMLLFGFFGGDLYDFYLAPLYPIFFLCAALLIEDMCATSTILRVLAILVLGVFLLMNGNALLRLHHSQGLAAKQAAVNWTVTQVNNHYFDLDSLSSCSRYNGTRYLFLLAGKEPTSSFMDSNYFWLYDEVQPRASDGAEENLRATFAVPSDFAPVEQERYNQIQKRTLESNRFGDIEVLISTQDGQTFSTTPAD